MTDGRPCGYRDGHNGRHRPIGHLEQMRKYGQTHRREANERRRVYYTEHPEAYQEHIERGHKYYADHRDKVKGQNAAYRAEHITECRQREKAWHVAHYEEVQRQRQEYYRTNRERITRERREYYIAHREERITEMREWHAAHREEQNEQKRKRYPQVKDQWNAQRRELRISNPEVLEREREYMSDPKRHFRASLLRDIRKAKAVLAEEVY